MKIAIIHQTSSVGGFRYLYNLVLGMKQYDENIDITIFTKTNNNSLTFELNNLKEHGVKLAFNFKFFKRKNKFKNKTLNNLYNNIKKKIYNKTLNTNKFDLFFYSWPYEIECLSLKKPIFFIPHDFIYSHSFGFDGIKLYDKNMYDTNLYYHKKFIFNNAVPIVSSDYIKNEFNRVFPNSLYKPNVVYLSEMNSYTRKPQNLVNEFFKKNNIDYDYVLFASNNMPHKNLGNLLGAWYYIKQKYPNLKLIISGYGNSNIMLNVNSPYYADHTNDENYDVKSTGLLNDEEFSLLLQGAKIVVNPSLCEAGNGSGLDAWKLGVPVAMSNIEPFINQVNYLGVKAETFDPRNSQDIARAILYLLDNPEIAKKNVQISVEAMNKYTWKDVGKQYLDIFEKYKNIKKNIKYLAIDLSYDFKIEESFGKEGIIIYTKFLINALLKNDNNLIIEIWCYSFNLEQFKSIFNDLIEKYYSRIIFFDESVAETKILTKIYKKKKDLKYHLRSGLLKFAYSLTKNEKYKRKHEKMKNKLTSIEKIDILKEELLKQSIKNYSNASYCYIPAVILKSGKYFSCPKFLQIHDLFTMIPEIEKLFTPIVPNIVEDNQKIVKNLNDYAKIDTNFITSNVFTRDEEILKFTNIQKNKVKVITFPPMIKQFSKHTTIEENDIRKKYNIEGNYIFYPTQNRPNKNVIVLLKALKKLKDKNIFIKLVITGRIDSYPLTLDFVNKNNLRDLIIETGFLSEDEVYTLYKYSTLIVVTTLIEGLGMPGQALEALSIGNIPVICSKCLGVEESLKSVGLTFKTADLNWFEPNDCEDLTKKIEDVLKNPKKHIEKQKHIIEYYTKKTWDDVAKDYLKLFNKNS